MSVFWGKTGRKRASNRHRHQHTFVRSLTHSHTCMPILRHQENNLQFKGLTWSKGHILSLSSQRRSSLTPLKRGRTSWWGVLRVKRRPCVTRTILPVCVCAHWGHEGVDTTIFNLGPSHILDYFTMLRPFLSPMMILNKMSNVFVCVSASVCTHSHMCASLTGTVK